ncbi:MAG TPA: GLUG motif-containing protein [Rhizomicrobium sp.]|nr:GLUG motif-containing protein [Rhizomicrobium sp.]
MRRHLLVTVLLGTVSAFGINAARADLVISKGHTKNVTCDAGVCNATAADAVLSVKDLASLLAASDVSVFAEGVATDITMTSPLHWASSHHLTLGAYGSLNVKSTVTVQGTAGLTITTNVAGNGGEYRLVGVGQISFWDTASSLTINGKSYTLFNTIGSLADAIANNPSGNYAFAMPYNAAQDGSYPGSAIPTPFHGSFDGLGNAIDKFTIFNANAPGSQLGFFYDIESDGQLSNVTLTNVSIQTSQASTGTIAADNHGTITHAYASGVNTGLSGANQRSGGLVYDNEGTITRSHAGVDMSNALYLGGLAALNGGTISLSDASGNISGAQVAGGLVAESDTTISACFATGNISLSLNENAIAGGLAGNAIGTIEQSFATGAVSVGTGTDGARTRKPNGVQAGGLVGNNQAHIHYAYATGSVTVEAAARTRYSSIGGLVGHNEAAGTLQQTYSTGAVTKIRTRKFEGGLIGYEEAPQGTELDNFWNLDTSTITDPSHGAGNVSYDKGVKGIPDSNFRKGTMRNFDGAIWTQKSSVNNGYPYFIANPPPR